MSTPPDPPEKYSDRTLVLRAQDGDSGAFELLIGRYQGRLFRIAYLMLGDRQDSEDVVQETLLTAWTRLHLLEDPEAVRSWLAQICTRRATDIARRRARRATDAHPPQILNTRADESPRADPAHTTQVNEQMRALALVLATMEPDLRSCWTLREIEGLSYREIVVALDITEATARGRLARARTHVIEYMKEWR